MRVLGARRDPATYVQSSVRGYRYPCPTLDHLDRHLRYLRVVEQATVNQERRDMCRLDIDRLLDRRCFLMMTTPSKEPS